MRKIESGLLRFFGYNDTKISEVLVSAVVRGYVPQIGKVGSQTSSVEYTENSGIIVSYNSKHAIEIIEKI